MEEDELYTTPDDVAEAMSLPADFGDDTYGFYRFSDTTAPTSKYVEHLIRSNMDMIDRRLQRSWGEHRVVDEEHTIETYWGDENGVRRDYFARGGNFVYLRRDLKEWDPMKGDRLYIRRIDGRYVDLTHMYGDGVVGSGNATVAGRFRFDRSAGKMYIMLGPMQTPYNAVKITYRYGSDDPVPESIRRLCSLMTAKQVINMSVFAIKVGQGSDIGSIKRDLIDNWDREIGELFSTWQRPGEVRSMLGRPWTRTSSSRTTSASSRSFSRRTGGSRGTTVRR